MVTARNAALAAALLEHAAATDRPLDALWGLIEETLDAAQARFAVGPAERAAWLAGERSWLTERAATLLERELQRHPQRHFRISLWLDRPDGDGEFLEERTVAAPTAGAAADAALMLSAFYVGCRVEGEM